MLRAAALDMKIIISPFSPYNYILNRFERIVIFLGMAENLIEELCLKCNQQRNYNRMYKINDKINIFSFNNEIINFFYILNQLSKINRN